MKERLDNMKTRLLLLPISLLLLLGGCNKANSKSNASQVSDSTSMVTLSETSISVSEERTHQLVATVDSSLERYLKFWSSNNEDIATVDDNGVVTAVKKGTTIVAIQVGQYYARCAVEVTDYIPDGTLSVSFSKDSYKLKVGDEFKLDATVKFGEELITDYQLSFESSDLNVATYLADSSFIKAVGKGECDILFTFTYLTYSVKELIYVNVFE